MARKKNTENILSFDLMGKASFLSQASNRISESEMLDGFKNTKALNAPPMIPKQESLYTSQRKDSLADISSVGKFHHGERHL